METTKREPLMASIKFKEPVVVQEPEDVGLYLTKTEAQYLSDVLGESINNVVGHHIFEVLNNVFKYRSGVGIDRGAITTDWKHPT